MTASSPHSIQPLCASGRVVSFSSVATEGQLDLTLFQQIGGLLPTLSLDLFASCRNKQLNRYLSLFPDLSAVDALSHHWVCPGILYAYPPTPLLTAVL